MAVRPINPDHLTPATIAVYDLMSDGAWYDNQILIAHGAQVCAREERDEALKNGRRVRRKALAKGGTLTDAELIESGSKDIIRNRLMVGVRGGRLERADNKHRMAKDTCRAWIAARPDLDRAAIALPEIAPKPVKAPTPARPFVATVTPIKAAAAAKKSTTRNNAPLIFGGIPEAEGFAAAPLELRSRVHFRTENLPVPLDEFRADLPAGSHVTLDEGDGLYRVDCDHGTGTTLRDFIRDWCDARGIITKSLRPEHDVRRRSLRDLEAQFLADLCVHYANYSKGRLRRHLTTLKFHFNDDDDLAQQVFEWILEAVSRFDDSQNVPFGAYLSQRLTAWVHDLNRNRYGRTLTDAELMQQRATQQFVSENGRKPTERELAGLLGQNLAANGDMEIPLPDANFSDDRIIDETTQSLLSQVMTRACAVDPAARGKLASNPNVLGWIAWYETTFCGVTKTDLAEGLSTSMRNMSVYADRVEERMQARREDIY